MTKARDIADLGAVTSRLDTVGASDGALSNRNLIINGAMQVAQRGTSATVSDGSNEGYSTVDRFRLDYNSAVGGAIDMSQSSDAPDGFGSSLKLQCSTTNTSFSGTDAVLLSQRIEAQNLQSLGYGSSGAKDITISWYMKAVTFSGPITLALETRDGTGEYYVKSYSPTTSWARYTCVVPASTSATINNDSGEGMFVKFVLAGSSGGTYAVSADSTAWSTTRADYRDNIGNFTSSTSNELYITGVQLEVGDTATPFEHRSYGDELARCQRYYQFNITNNGYTNITTSCRLSITGSQEMRAVPSLSIANGTNAVEDYGIASRNMSSLASLSGGTTLGGLVDAVIASSTAAKPHALFPNAIAMDAEL